LGGAFLVSGSLAAAIVALKQALSLSPSHLDALYNYALAHQRATDVEAADLAYSRAISIFPKHFEARRNLAVIRHQQGSVSAAIDLLRRLVDEAPDRPDVRENLGIALLDADRTVEAAHTFMESAYRRYGVGGTPLPVGSPHLDVTPTKLKHDAEQLDYLLERQLVSPAMAGVRDLYLGILADTGLEAAPAQPLMLDEAKSHEIAPWFARHYARTDPPVLPAGAINSALDWSTIERDYLNGRPEIVIVDQFLRVEALAALRAFCLESAIWGRSYGGGYLGSFMEDGFFCPLLAQVADELRARLPQILQSHRLRKVWGFKYDSLLSGINLHADFAAVNVNFWVTPDEANADPTCGGLIVWDKGAPPEWSFADYNQSPERARAFLDNAGATPVNIPYRANRVVIFNSNLFHETDRIAFRSAYPDRRVNITLLYGTQG